jgi:hypothetical protein
MQKDTERAQSLSFQRPQTRAAVRESYCRLLLQGFGHEPSNMRQVEKPCSQLGCCATVFDVVRGRACSSEVGQEMYQSRQFFLTNTQIGSRILALMVHIAAMSILLAEWVVGRVAKGQGDDIEGSL